MRGSGGSGDHWGGGVMFSDWLCERGGVTNCRVATPLIQ